MTGDADMDRGDQGASPRWTLWTAAYAYAEVMRDLSMAKYNPEGDRAEYFDVPTMLVAYALAAYADEERIAVTRPADLADLSGMALWERLATPRLLASLSTLPSTSRAVTPAAGEPAHDLFFRMLAEIDRANEPGVGQDDEQRRAKARRGDRAWYQRGEDGQALVAHVLLTYVSPEDRNRGVTPLRVITDRAEGATPEEDHSPFAHPSRRPYELSEYMAADEPRPERDTPQWAMRVLRATMAGKTFLLHYLTSINDRDVDVPNSLVAPRKASESAEAYAQREHLAKLFTDTHVQLADHSPDVANELMHIRPSDAQDAVAAITQEALEWWTAAEYDATVDNLLPAMKALLDGLVAPERRGDVQDLLKVFTSGGDVPLFRARLRISGAAVDHPFEALHVAAAFAGALYQVPACVPDPDAAYLRLVTAAMRLSEGKVDSPRPASTSPSQPAPSAGKADARKKAARKAARKSRRQGRR